LGVGLTIEDKVRFLSSRPSLDCRIEIVEVIETHMSWYSSSAIAPTR